MENDTSIPVEAVETAVKEELFNVSETAVKKEPFNVPETVLSKNKRKKLERQKRWLEGKAERRQKERQKEKERRALKKANDIKNGILPDKTPKVKMEDSACKVTVVIDCDYAQFMGQDLLRKLCKQLTRCYSSNRASTAPVQFYLTSVTGTMKEALDTYQPGHVNWDCHVTDKHWSELFLTEKKLGKSDLIYLSGDSPDDTPNPKDIQKSNNQVFIIGGLLDHNQHKGLSLKRARKFQIKHGKLPIGEHIKMCQRQILSIPHVFDIMAMASNGTFGQDWAKIFEKVIPKRKIASEEPKIAGEKAKTDVEEIKMEVEEPKVEVEETKMDVEACSKN